MTIEELRETLRADSGVLVREGMGDAVTPFRLVLQDASCGEYILPRVHVARVPIATIRESHPEMSWVRVEDPPEAL